MQDGVNVDSFNPLNILAVAAGLKHKHSGCYCEHSSENCCTASALPVDSRDCGVCEGGRQSEATAIVGVGSAEDGQEQCKCGQSGGCDGMKSPPNGYINGRVEDSGVSHMFEEHNYDSSSKGNKNYMYIIADEPLNTDKDYIEGDEDDVVASRVVERRHDSGYSDTIADCDTPSSNENALSDDSCLLDIIDPSNDLDEVGHAIDESSIVESSESDSSVNHAANPDNHLSSPETRGCLLNDNKAISAADVSTIESNVTAESRAIPQVNSVSSRCTNGNNRQDEPPAAAHQTIIKSLLTGRTIIVSKPDTESVDAKLTLRSSSVTSPASCDSSSSLILSPDSAYNTDSNMTDDAFLIRSPDLLTSLKSDPHVVDDTVMKVPLSPASTASCHSDAKRCHTPLSSSLPALSVFSPHSIAVASEYSEDTKKSLSRLLVKNSNSVNDPLSINSESSPYKSVYNDNITINTHKLSFISPQISLSDTESRSKMSTPSIVGQFRIGSFGSFSNKIVPAALNRNEARTVPHTTTETSVFSTPQHIEDISKAPSSLFQPISVSPSDVLDIHVSANSSIDPVSLDHDYCLKHNGVPLTIQQPKLGRPPTKMNKKRGRNSKKDALAASKSASPIISEVEDLCEAITEPLDLLSTQIFDDIKHIDSPLSSPTRRLSRRDESIDEPEDQDAKVKITGNYQDQFVYYACKTDRVTRRQRSKLPQVQAGTAIPTPTAADIIVPRLSDSDIVALQTGKSPPPSRSRVPPLHGSPEKADKLATEDDDSQVINAILNMENPTDDVSYNTQGATDELSELTTEQMNMLFNAIDEIQSKSHGLESIESDKVKVEEIKDTGQINNVDKSTESKEYVSFADGSLENSTDVSVKQAVAGTTGTDNTPWIVIVTVYWNDLPAVMLDMQPYVRLIDIYKQILPAKDTGILKKRCLLMGLEVRNCTEMQRYFLVKYGHAHNSKSSLVVSKQDANQLIGFYVDPQPKGGKTESRCKKTGPRQCKPVKTDGRCPSSVALREDERQPRPVFADVFCNPVVTLPSEPLGRLRHKKINFRGMLRGGVASDDDSDMSEMQKSPDARNKRPRRPYTKRSLRSSPNKSSVIKTPVSNGDGVRFTKRQPRANGFCGGIKGHPKTSNVASLSNDLSSTVARLQSAKSDQVTQTAHLSDDFATDSESSPDKRTRCLTPSDSDSSPTKFKRDKTRSTARKRRLSQLDTPCGHSTRTSNRGEGSPRKRFAVASSSKRSLSTTTVAENHRGPSSGVITISNGALEYDTFTALDDDLSF